MNESIIENMNRSDLLNFFDTARPFFKMITYYGCAMREVETKLRVLDDEFRFTHDRNPIESIKTRIKTVDSIMKKLEKKGIAIDVADIDGSIEKIEGAIFDIAGIRVICAFPEDIYKISDRLVSQDDVKLIREKDYIRTPKENGYRSLHLIIETPVFFSSGRRDMKVEVQFRTIAMDFWASLEHKMKYKKDIRNHEYIAEELRKCADTISATDYRMQELHWLIDSQ